MPTSLPQLHCLRAFHLDRFPVDFVSLVTSYTCEDDSTQIMSSARSKIVQRLYCGVSPPYHHVHTYMRVPSDASAPRHARMTRVPPDTKCTSLDNILLPYHHVYTHESSSARAHVSAVTKHTSLQSELHRSHFDTPRDFQLEFLTKLSILSESRAVYHVISGVSGNGSLATSSRAACS